MIPGQWTKSTACTSGQCVEVVWKKSSASTHGNCVEVGQKKKSDRA